MCDWNALNTALRKYDTAKVASIFENNGSPAPDAARKFVMAVRQSACLVIPIRAESTESRREELIERCRELLSKSADAAVIEDFEHHVEDAKIVEHGYRVIFKTMHESEIWKQSPAAQAWAVIKRAELELAHVKQATDKAVEKLAAQKYSSFDARQFRIEDEDGYSVRPDSVLSGLVKNAGDTLVALAHVHGWLDRETGVIVLPAEVACTEAIADQAGTFSLVASQWRSLEHAWDRSRLFGARFRLRSNIATKQSQKEYTVLESSSASVSELMDRIALARVEQVYFQSQKGADIRGRNKQPSQVVGSNVVPLAKAAYLSEEEQVAVDVLDGNYCVPVDDDSLIIAGLSVKAWVRGYAHYVRMARNSSGVAAISCSRLSEGDLVSGFESAGLSSDQAKLFIQLTVFGQGAADLFDAPLLRVSDGSYCFFSPAYQTPSIGLILLSRISSLNRRRDEHGEAANDCQFRDKGKLFETYVLKLFNQAGIPACGFKYSLNGTDYDCDVAALIDDTLFVFECKNRSLPMGHVPSLHYFLLALNEATDQVKRIVRDFCENPEVVRGRFGENAKWSRIVPVVLHSLPWSFGVQNDVYVYDASALSHLLRTGFTSVMMESQLGTHRIVRRHRYQLRKGERPTAEELEREMKTPHQLRLHSLGWEQVSHEIPVSDNLVFALPEWTQRPVDLKQQLSALGSTEEEADLIAKEMEKEFPEGVQKIRQQMELMPKRKIGRNEPCPCGSGIKYKRCCLKI